MIKANSHKYSVSAMCRVLKISRSTYYYKSKEIISFFFLTKLIKDIFDNSRESYGTRRIKVKLANLGHMVSRRKIARIMKVMRLVSKYTVAKFKPQYGGNNEEKT